MHYVVEIKLTRLGTWVALMILILNMQTPDIIPFMYFQTWINSHSNKNEW